MEEKGFENADIVFITDGECVLPPEFISRLQEEQVRRRFTITGILLDQGNEGMDFSLKAFCQNIYRTSELTGDAFQDHLNNGTPEKTTLMLQMLLREIDNLRSDITSAERELRCFILTKVLPYLGYQMALSSHLDPALTPIKSPNFFRRDAYARTYACLSAYLPTIDIWNEYKNQNPETLEKPWNTLRKLYQDSNPDISDLTAAIPYTVFPSGLLCHHGRNISFCHDNYRDFFAAFHIANVVYGLYSGIDLAALSPDAQEVFLLQLETLDNSILFDAISILRQYFGLSIYDISAQDTTDLSDTCAQIALPAILIRLLDAVIRRGELSKNEHSQLCQLRSTLCERFVLSFKALDESDPLQTKYCLFFSLALSMLARDYRTGVAGTRDLIKCAGYAQQCINGEKKLNIPKADGYLQVALCLNARMEDMICLQKLSSSFRSNSVMLSG